MLFFNAKKEEKEKNPQRAKPWKFFRKQKTFRYNSFSCFLENFQGFALIEEKSKGANRLNKTYF